ncbi:uncharacterized protein LOC111279379 [Durio zibethinus]|uniref:Uncharacterized protein LOC111279379 n=1 Tax=Durio zibethinus TaxID=66656 RepID=A0A6P5X2N5_DURZI|nr:uncharacterized protein LOC111279379 [Durio zibethinus]
MTNLGMMHYYLGIEVIQFTAGIFIFQKKYVQDILDMFRMKDYNPITTPIEAGMKLDRNPKGKKVNNTFYKQNVGSLMYLTATRPDIKQAIDSDYARDLDNRKRKSGYAFMMGTAADPWTLRKQSIITMSTTEAEFVAAAACACQAIWLQKILKEFSNMKDLLSFSVTIAQQLSYLRILFCMKEASIKM